MTADFRLQLRELRQAQTLSQEQLAEQLGISRQSIISLERGEYLPSFPLFIEIIRFFNCPIENLVEGIALVPTVEIESDKEGGETDMAITPWNPFQAIDHIQDEMAEMVDRSFGRADWSRVVGASVGAMNVHEDENEYQLDLQVPGYGEGDITVEVSEDGVLTISGANRHEEKKNTKAMVRREWEHSEFSRSIRFASPVAMDKVEAKLENGRLLVSAPKIEPLKPKTTKVQIKKS